MPTQAEFNTAQETARALLRAAAVARPDPARLQAIAVAAMAVTDWQLLAGQAELHNLGPLLHHHLKQIDGLDPTGRRTLAALAVRHRHANATLTTATEEILRAFASSGIECVVLKGMALSHTIYPEFRLRPMRDVDLLVPTDRAAQGQALLGELGFTLPSGFDYGMGGGRYMRNHHHLPIASLERDGMTVSVELHTDALSGDYPETLSYNVVAPNTRDIMVGDTNARAMGHHHMLTHLLRHLLEPAPEIRIGGVCDVVSYASFFHQEIDWDRLDGKNSFVRHATGLLHYVSPLPDELAAIRPAAPAPDGAGFGMRTLGSIVSAPVPWKQRIAELLYPPSWWLLAYYGAAPDASVNALRWRRHLPRLVRWFYRRIKAAAGA